jgi:hypothetical protein
MTTEVYGHLAPGDLKKEIDRIRFEPLPARQRDAEIAVQAPGPVAASAAGTGSADDLSGHAAGGASESPQPATGTVLRLAAPVATGARDRSSTVAEATKNWKGSSRV